MSSLLIVLVSFLLFWQVIDGYRPVIVMHGILDDASSMDDLVALIKQTHPGTDVYNVDVYNDLESFTNMWEQVEGVQKKIAPIISNVTDGINLICYSQGGLLCRGFLEAYPDHNVKTFVSLSSPQAGQFGSTAYMDWFFPNITRDNLYLACYTDIGQDISVCNYWNDPKHQLQYQEFSNFLYPLNSGTSGQYCYQWWLRRCYPRADFKTNFIKLEALVMIGGPDDGVITPWQSSHFGFYDDKLVVQPYQNQQFYKSDSFGLKTLDEAGKIYIHEVPGVKHVDWHGDKAVFDNYIAPYLM